MVKAVTASNLYSESRGVSSDALAGRRYGRTAAAVRGYHVELRSFDHHFPCRDAARIFLIDHEKTRSDPDSSMRDEETNPAHIG